MKELLIGGARSGKTRLAQQRAQESGLPVTVIVTGQPSDPEMALRIARHQADRPQAWQVVEAPVRLSEALQAHAQPGRFVIVDCLTLWLGRLLADAYTLAEPLDATHLPVFQRERRALLETLPQLGADIVLVSNEVGLGIVPLAAETRLFRDEAGRLNQDVAGACDAVTLVAAGLPLALKRPA